MAYLLIQRRARRPLRLLPILAVVSAAVLATTGEMCAGDEAACQREPLGSLRAFFMAPGEGGTRQARGTVVKLKEVSGDFVEVTLRDSLGGLDSLRYRGGGPPLPLRMGETYDIRIDFAGGFPSSSAILVHDDSGLLFAGATDQTPGARVLTAGIPGFQVLLVPSECGSRDSDRCYDSITNAILRVSHAGETKDLYNAQSTRLGGYEVTCLTAQDVEYSNDCNDAGLPGLSYAITRAAADSIP